MKIISKNRLNINKSTKIALLISFFFIILLLLTVNTSIPISELESNGTNNKPFVSFHNLSEPGKDLILKEQSLLFDSEPIFLPTEWNKSSNKIENVIGEPLFRDFPPIITLYDLQKLESIINEHPSVSSPADILNNKFVSPFVGINQSNISISPPINRKAHIMIQSLNNSNIVASYGIIGASNLNEELWIPIEFILVVDESGPILPLFVIESSGSEKIDLYFRNYISKLIFQHTPLPEGYYKISVGP